MNKELTKENCKKARPKCPHCGKEVEFYIQGSIWGEYGVLHCKCGYSYINVSNLQYATKEDWEKFEEASKGIMW